MRALRIFLAMALAAPTVAAEPDPRPGQRDYSVAKAFAVIVRRNAEVDVAHLSYAFGLPELLNLGFTWQGPTGPNQQALFYAYYEPRNSDLGITKIVITWDNEPLSRPESKSAILLSMSIFLRPASCPTEAQMVSATGVSATKYVAPGLHGGLPYLGEFFAMPDDNGKTRIINYSPGQFCELRASYLQER